MHHQVFNDAAARTLLRVLSREHIAIRSISLAMDPEITVLIPDSDFTNDTWLNSPRMMSHLRRFTSKNSSSGGTEMTSAPWPSSSWKQQTGTLIG